MNRDTGAEAGAFARAFDAASWSVELRPMRVRFGQGSLARLGEGVEQLGGSRVLVVTDRGIVGAGHVERAVVSIEGAGLGCWVFDGVEENPTERHVAAGVEVARRRGVDFLVGLGGGSSMDCAKGVNFLLTNGGRMADYWGMGKATRPMLASIGVPCTAGTGSEAQSFAIISREGDHRKMACGDPKARFTSVLLDPEVVRTAPREVVAMTGLDALSHALESLVTRVRNPLSSMLAREAFASLDRHFEAVLEPRADLTDWGEMLIGAHFAGAAIETSMLGAAHALANPLTAGFEVAHGAAIAIVLPAVVRFNGELLDRVYNELRPVAGEWGAGAGSGPFSESLARRIEELRRRAGLPETLRDVGVGEADLARLAEQAADQWTAGFNPRPVGAEDLLELYRQAY
ncbi:MAG TPA: iron-containing alcohol dehydrogenase [Thermoanaerobaculia bacterium]|nr:iron-containing alcohol dehydrogenase [Thermoanaerobaculia bacterium]